MKKKYSKGQITIFVVLIFQIFFIFLAMVINIGLVVHDKINLQNSVDLAAIYAAQRQAEVLNTMAHINYQIRQSYKLLAWRYLVLGNTGANKSSQHRGNRRRYTLNAFDNPSSGAHCPNTLNRCQDGGHRNNCELDIIKSVCPYVSCFYHEYFYVSQRVNAQNIHFCQYHNPRDIGIERPRVDIGLDPIAIGYTDRRNLVRSLHHAIRDACIDFNQVNWIMAASIFYIYRMDQYKRRLLIEDIFNKILKENRDIEGQLIENGVIKTIKNNLTAINLRSLESEENQIINFETSTTGKSFKNFFEWDQIDPILLFAYTNSSDSNLGREGICTPRAIAPLHAYDGVSGIYADEYLKDCLQQSPPGPDDSSNPCYISIGFFKKFPISRDNTFWVKVTSTVNYKNQMFSPIFGGTPLTATAFAKPFGALFGPPKNGDPLLPEPAPSSNGFSQIPNHSVYIGDRLGMVSRKVQKGWNQILHTIPTENPLILQGNSQQLPMTGATYVNYHFQRNDPMMVQGYNVDNSQINRDRIFNLQIRAFEEMAISPDLFDAAYYTILPNYMTTLYSKLRKSELINHRDFPRLIEAGADLGHISPASVTVPVEYGDGNGGGPQTPQPNCLEEQNFRLDYINKQVSCTRSIARDNQDFDYKITDTQHLLTSWAPPEKRYRPGPFYKESDFANIFGLCQVVTDHRIETKNLVDRTQRLLPSNCLYGGRAGFSVKLVSELAL